MSPRGSAWTVYLRLLRYVRPHLGLLLLAFCGLLIDAAAHAAFVALMQPLLDETFIARDMTAIRWLPVVILALFLVRGVASFTGDFGMLSVGRRVVHALRQALYDKALALPAATLDRGRTGTLVTQLVFHVEQVAAASTQALTILIRDSLTVLGLIAVMLWHSVQLTLALAILVPVLALVVTVVNRRFRRISTRIQDSVSQVTQIAEETLRGHRVVKVYGASAHERERFAGVNLNNLRLHLKMAATDALAGSTVQFVAASALALIIYIATLPGVIEQMSPGSFMSVMSAMLLLLPSLKRLTSVHAMLGKGIAAAEAVFATLDQANELDHGQHAPERVNGRIDFDGVVLRYDDQSAPALDGVSLTIAAGEFVALVGRSGSGKTSLAALVPRFYEPTAGVVRLDGVPLGDYQIGALRRQIAYVGQEVTLFDDSVVGNVAYGELAAASREQIAAALADAQASEFVGALGAGVDSAIGEGGGRLSGGQRQRLSIARALLKAAPILILDEATSALDTQAERALAAALETLARNRTTLVIAHRLSTVRRADRIVVLDAGRVVEQGSHEQLLAASGVYAELVRSELSAGDAARPA